MKSAWSVVALLILGAGAVAAQTGSQTTLILSMIGGVSSGNKLWDLALQPLCLPEPTCAPSDPHDTLRIARTVNTGFEAGIMASLFRGPHLGFSIELLYLGVPLEDACTALKLNPDPGADSVYGPRNKQLCDNISSASLSTSAIAVMGGAVLRAAPRGAFSHYVRGGFGVTAYATSTNEVSGLFLQGGQLESRAVVVDPHPKSLGFSGQVAVGFTEKLGPGYQFRLEVQDAMIPLQHLTGPANDLAQAPSSTKLFHRLALRFGLDVVLEQKRGRRY